MRYLRIPIEPTPAILREMRNATFLADGSNLEMRRRYNGLLEAAKRLPINKRRQRIASARGEGR